LLYNPFYDDEGKRKSGLGYDKFVFLPLCILSINARVKLLTPVAKAAGLIRGARGRIIRFLYSNNANYGPAHPGASFEEAVTSTHQLQVPVVLVQFDAADYTGKSCLDDPDKENIPRVVPIYPTKCTIEVNGFKYEREMLPIECCMADTVHSLQGTTVEEAVIVPPGGRNDDFTRGLLYVALSRVKTLQGLYLIIHHINAKMFTKWRKQIDQIEKELIRLRKLPKWSGSQLSLEHDVDDSFDFDDDDDDDDQQTLPPLASSSSSSSSSASSSSSSTPSSSSLPSTYERRHESGGAYVVSNKNDNNSPILLAENSTNNKRSRKQPPRVCKKKA
jgi:hypothetical protein